MYICVYVVYKKCQCTVFTLQFSVVTSSKPMFVSCFLKQFLELYNQVFYYHTYFIDVEPLMEQEDITKIILLFDVSYWRYPAITAI
jgi:hypothetical protein